MITADQIAQHLSMSKRHAYETLKTLGLDRNATMQQVRQAYIEHLRSVAAGRGGSQQESLAAAKTEEAQVRTALNRLAYNEKLATLVLADDVLFALKDWAGYASREYQSGTEKIVELIENDHGISVNREAVKTISGSTTKRIQNYAEKLGQKFIACDTAAQND